LDHPPLFTLTIKLNSDTLIIKVKDMKNTYSSILVEFFEQMNSWEHSIAEGRAISLAQLHLLEVVGDHRSMRMKELSERLGVTTGTLTVMVHRLLSKGYVIKKKDSDDRRSFFIELTQIGKEEYAYHHHMHEHLIEEITRELGEPGSEAFFRQLEQVTQVMEEPS
jgi:DNA-binding MarR family transcriptional regulator